MTSDAASPATNATDRRFARLEADVVDLVDRVLLPAAADVDRSSIVPPGHYRALADAGLYGMTAPVEFGGLGLAPSQVRRILRLLSSGCGATTFSFAQHLGTVAAVSSTDNTTLQDRWLPSLVDDTLSGTAYAHLRRSGPPVLRAEPAGHGWRFSGLAPWVSSWGSARVLSVAARSADDRIVWALVEAGEQPGLSVDRIFDLMVFGATRTAALRLDGIDVTGAVLSEHEADAWIEVDRALAARPNPCSLGIGDRALILLADVAPDEAASFGPWWDGVAERAEEASAAVDRREGATDDIAAVRAEVLTAVQTLTGALLAAVGGGAMVGDHPAQRLHREAAFYVIQAQSPPGRRAFLDRLRPDDRDRGS